ncbi:unnamed protein product, partial [Prorocentrum cordatum]
RSRPRTQRGSCWTSDSRATTVQSCLGRPSNAMSTRAASATSSQRSIVAPPKLALLTRSARPPTTGRGACGKSPQLGTSHRWQTSTARLAKLTPPGARRAPSALRETRRRS